MLLIGLLVHLLLEVKPSLLFRLTEIGIEMTAFEKHLACSLLGSTSRFSVLEGDEGQTCLRDDLHVRHVAKLSEEFGEFCL